MSRPVECVDPLGWVTIHLIDRRGSESLWLRSTDLPQRIQSRSVMPSSTNPLSVLAISLAGFSLVLHVVSGPAPGGVNEPAQAGLEQDDSKVLDRFAKLEAENRALLDRLSQLESLRASGQRSSVTVESVPRSELVSLAREVFVDLSEGGALATRTSPIFQSPEFQDAVARSIREIDIARATEDAELWVDNRSEYLRENMLEAAERLGMGSSQSNQLESAIVACYEAQAQWDVMHANGQLQTDMDWATLLEEDHASFVAKLETFLNPDQVEIYLALGDDWVFPYSEDLSDWEESWEEY